MFANFFRAPELNFLCSGCLGPGRGVVLELLTEKFRKNARVDKVLDVIPKNLRISMFLSVGQCSKPGAVTGRPVHPPICTQGLWTPEEAFRNSDRGSPTWIS